MWNVALEKKKIVWVVMSPILKKTSLREFMQLRQSIQKILYRVDNLKNRKNKNVNKTGLKRKCMDSLSEKCQRMLIRLKLGNGYPNKIGRLGQKHCYVPHRNRPSEQTM